MTRRLCRDWILAAALALLPACFAPPASGLYLFLDSNGDSIRTSADVLSPHDTTHVTVWLVTNEFKEETSDACSHGNREGDRSYSVVFHASGGMVDWGPFIPDPPAHGEQFSTDSDDSTYLMVSRRISDWGTTHRIRLGTFTVRVSRGRPSIDIIDQRPQKPFGETRIETGTWGGPLTPCADGLPYGGQANRPPALVRLGDCDFPAATDQRLWIVASDLDHDPLTFRLIQGPSFLSVTTLDPGHGDATGEIHAAPDSCARGPAECIIEVSDGFKTDTDTMLVRVHPIVRALPISPMRAARPGPSETAKQDSSAIDVGWLVGEWEWHDSGSGKTPMRFGPAYRGYRWRLAFQRDGGVELFEVGLGRIQRTLRGRFGLAGTLITFSTWPQYDSIVGPETFVMWKEGSSSFSIYPWRVFDAGSDAFVRVPAVVKNGAAPDTARLIAPIDTPTLSVDTKSVRVNLPKSMQKALHDCDPSFRLWSRADFGEVDLEPGQNPDGWGATAIVGDFDGDLLRDVALLGRSGADQVVIAVLSNHGNMRAVEVAWRRLRPGPGERRSREDPERVPPVYLELAARGTFNPFCWVSGWGATPLDAVGIVEPGVARFDYLYAGGQFSLLAPRP
jgi:hypothetical protein